MVYDLDIVTTCVSRTDLQFFRLYPPVRTTDSGIRCVLQNSYQMFSKSVCRRYRIIHWANITRESLVGCLLKAWPRPPLIKLIHGFNKWGTGGRCACRRAHQAHRHPSHWSGIFSRFSLCSSLTRPLQMLLAYSPVWPEAILTANSDGCTHTHSGRQRRPKMCENARKEQEWLLSISVVELSLRKRSIFFWSLTDLPLIWCLVNVLVVYVNHQPPSTSLQYCTESLIVWKKFQNTFFCSSVGMQYENLDTGKIYLLKWQLYMLHNQWNNQKQWHLLV